MTSETATRIGHCASCDCYGVLAPRHDVSEPVSVFMCARCWLDEPTELEVIEADDDEPSTSAEVSP